MHGVRTTLVQDLNNTDILSYWGKYKFHNLKKVQTGNEQYILQEVKPWKLGMHAQLIPTHRQFKVQYSTYATMHVPLSQEQPKWRS